ncbi:hypothetical protein [Rhodospirillum centenum]|uniref:Uncharacterized protein n=1 Tax=Rhodospirillum centenum (strain ATCC 51521 / SW) TaxID=414684 RepID=B6IRX7_RHOCS|nr:hypothetical protein [Rhodospirillum centenum]ACI98213.1 hypothetical protein RC1_0782 [Rhodospirillum centenum SW]
MKLEDRLAVKLLAQAQSALGKAVNETLCTEPDRRIVRAMVAEAAELIREFNEQYFDLSAAETGRGPGGPPAGEAGMRRKP